MKETLVEALKISGNILMQYFRKPLSESVKESQSSIVTEADYASDAIIKELISARFPEHNIISEETGFIDNGSDYTWIIDPLDGTSNFAAGIPWFGVLITILKGNVPELAGAYMPASDMMYVAERGKGATRNGEVMHVIKEKNLKDSLFAFCVDYTEDAGFLDRGLDIYKHIVLNSRNIRSTNCLIDFIYVAEGRFGGVLNLYTKIWDISGLSLLIAETGGEMKNIDGNDVEFKLSDNIAEINFPVIAGNRAIIRSLEKEIMNLIR
ncbi:MAG TPA: inositol monophosphatase [Bacteroidales bacterium]|nr:inositol monophosphatase [Bacteroidales bacterium]